MKAFIVWYSDVNGNHRTLTKFKLRTVNVIGNLEHMYF